MNNTKMKAQSAVFERMLRPAAWGTILCVAILFVLLLVFSAVLSTQDIPLSAVQPFILAALSVACILGGYCAARILKEKGVLVGLATAFLTFLVLLISSFFIKGSTLGVMTLTKMLLIAIANCIGGVWGVNYRYRK